jgi:hypothetical protein
VSNHLARIDFLNRALARCDPAEPCPAPLMRVYDALVEVLAAQELPEPALRALRQAVAVQECAPLSGGVLLATLAELADALEAQTPGRHDIGRSDVRVGPGSRRFERAAGISADVNGIPTAAARGTT